jgi:archaellum component FlaC
MPLPEDRLTILEMEYAIVAARLNTIDAELALIKAEVGQIKTDVSTIKTDVRRIDDTTVRLERMLLTVIRHLGLEPPATDEPS